MCAESVKNISSLMHLTPWPPLYAAPKKSIDALATASANSLEPLKSTIAQRLTAYENAISEAKKSVSFCSIRPRKRGTNHSCKKEYSVRT